MTQLSVTLTDYALVSECLIFSGLLAKYRNASSTVPIWFVVFFSFSGLAALSGGTFHGFFSDGSSLGHRILWPTTMIAIGVAALAAARIASGLLFGGSVALFINRAVIAVFIFYCVVILFINSEFRIAIFGYLPALFFLGWAFFVAYRRNKRRAFLIGLFGLAATLLAAVVQQANISISPQYFNNNALYHVIQGVGLYMFFVAAIDVCKSLKV